MAILTLKCGLRYQKNYNNKNNKIQQCVVMRTSSELFTAKICTKPSKPTGLPNRRKDFEVRRCPVRVLNMYMYMYMYQHNINLLLLPTLGASATERSKGKTLLTQPPSSTLQPPPPPGPQTPTLPVPRVPGGRGARRHRGCEVA